jgi:hypothetical protein
MDPENDTVLPVVTPLELKAYAPLYIQRATRSFGDDSSRVRLAEFYDGERSETISMPIDTWDYPCHILTHS